MMTTSTTRQHFTAVDDRRQRTGPGIEEFRRWDDATGMQAAEERLAELSREWDIDRVLEAGVPAAVVAGFLLASTGSRRWLLLPLVTCGALVVKRFRGENPLVPVLQLLGFRTTAEINHERQAIKALRGDLS